jgi:chondroitin AC lyase
MSANFLHPVLRMVYWASVSVATFFAGASASPAADVDLQVLHDRLLEMSLQGKIDAKAVEGHSDSLKADGSWGDLDYADPSLTNWQPSTHIERLLAMARAYRRDDSPMHGDEKLKSSVFAAFDFWTKKPPKCKNWWHNEIGVPLRMLQVLFLMEPQLSPERMRGGLKVLEAASIRATGQNLVWLAQITGARACLIGDGELCAKAFGAIADEIRITTKEGIQPDMSFHQHGAQLYNGGYGLGFSNDCARIAVLVKGTRFAFSPKKIEILSRYILDGQQWMFRGLQMDYSVMGRAITRSGDPSTGMIDGCDNMAKLDTPDRAKFLAFVRTLKGESPPGAALVGNKQFWRSDYMMHRRADYSASVRMASTRNRRTELVNRENLKGDHLSDGLTYIYRRGDEYRNIFPLWDWRKLPGTTCLQGDRPFQPGKAGNGKTTFVGGVSDGTYGCAAMDFAIDGITAKKAWFFFDREFVCLGAGITCDAGDAVATTVNQCLLKGDVAVRDAGGIRKLEKGSHTVDAARWVQHNGIGYAFLGTSPIHVTSEARKGTWKSINDFQKTDEVAGDVFCLWIDHGPKPAAGEYRYIVAPAAGPSELDQYAASSPIEVLSNTTEIQAVEHHGLSVAEIAFHKAARLTAGPLSVASDAPCLVLLKGTGGKVRLAASNPENRPLELTLEIKGHFSGEGCEWDEPKGVTRIHLSLPGGEMAGSSVVRELR